MPKDVIGSTLSTSFKGSTDHPLFASDGTFYLKHKVTLHTWSSNGLDVSTTPCHGVAYIIGNAGTNGASCKLTIAAPYVGCQKTVVLGTTAASTDCVYIDLTSACGLYGTTGTLGNRYINFSSLASDVQSVTLVGLTTAMWGLLSIAGSTLMWQNAAGIRASSTPSS